MNFIQSNDFSLSVALDGGALVVTYPYNKPVQTGNTTLHSLALLYFIMPLELITLRGKHPHCTEKLFLFMLANRKLDVIVGFVFVVNNEANLKYLAMVYAKNHPRMHPGDTLCYNNGQSTTFNHLHK